MKTVLAFDVDDTLAPTSSIIARACECDGGANVGSTLHSKRSQQGGGTASARRGRKVADAVAEGLDGEALDPCEAADIECLRATLTAEQRAVVEEIDATLVQMFEELAAADGGEERWVCLVTAAGAEGFQAVLSFLPRFREWLGAAAGSGGEVRAARPVHVFTNNCADSEAEKVEYKTVVFQNLVLQAATGGSAVHLVSIGDGSAEQRAAYQVAERWKAGGVAANSRKAIGVDQLPELCTTVVKLRDEEDYPAKSLLQQLKLLKALLLDSDTRPSILDSAGFDRGCLPDVTPHMKFYAAVPAVPVAVEGSVRLICADYLEAEG